MILYNFGIDTVVDTLAVEIIDDIPYLELDLVEQIVDEGRVYNIGMIETIDVDDQLIAIAYGYTHEMCGVNFFIYDNNPAR